jgi:hypothetical protein
MNPLLAPLVVLASYVDMLCWLVRSERRSSTFKFQAPKARPHKSSPAGSAICYNPI